MSEMIERVAAAIIAQLRADAEKFGAWEQLEDKQHPDDWVEDFGPKNNGKYDGKLDAVALARAAIEAMRDPTKASMSERLY